MYIFFCKNMHINPVFRKVIKRSILLMAGSLRPPPPLELSGRLNFFCLKTTGKGLNEPNYRLQLQNKKIKKKYFYFIGQPSPSPLNGPGTKKRTQIKLLLADMSTKSNRLRKTETYKSICLCKLETVFKKGNKHKTL